MIGVSAQLAAIGAAAGTLPSLTAFITLSIWPSCTRFLSTISSWSMPRSSASSAIAIVSAKLPFGAPEPWKAPFGQMFE